MRILSLLAALGLVLVSGRADAEDCGLHGPHSPFCAVTTEIMPRLTDIGLLIEGERRRPTLDATADHRPLALLVFEVRVYASQREEIEDIFGKNAVAIAAIGSDFQRLAMEGVCSRRSESGGDARERRFLAAGGVIQYDLLVSCLAPMGARHFSETLATVTLTSCEAP